MYGHFCSVPQVSLKHRYHCTSNIVISIYLIYLLATVYMKKIVIVRSNPEYDYFSNVLEYEYEYFAFWTNILEYKYDSSDSTITEYEYNY